MKRSRKYIKCLLIIVLFIGALSNNIVPANIAVAAELGTITHTYSFGGYSVWYTEEDGCQVSTWGEVNNPSEVSGIPGSLFHSETGGIMYVEEPDGSYRGIWGVVSGTLYEISREIQSEGGFHNYVKNPNTGEIGMCWGSSNTLLKVTYGGTLTFDKELTCSSQPYHPACVPPPPTCETDPSLCPPTTDPTPPTCTVDCGDPPTTDPTPPTCTVDCGGPGPTEPVLPTCTYPEQLVGTQCENLRPDKPTTSGPSGAAGPPPPPTWTLPDLFTDNNINEKLIGGKTTNDLFDLGKKTGLQVKVSNVPQNGIVNITTKQFYPEVSIKNDDNITNFPLKATDATKDQWKRYKDKNNKLTVFTFKVKSFTDLPDDPIDLFTRTSQYQPRRELVVTKENDWNEGDLTLTEPGYYVIGTKLESGGRTTYDFKALKVEFDTTPGFLPVYNNLKYQVNETMLVTNKQKNTHEMNSLLFNTQTGKSLKVPSAFNYKYNLTAIGSHNGSEELSLFNGKLKHENTNPTIPANSKVTEIIECDEGFLVTTYNNGLYYINLKDNKAYKVNGVGTDKLNYIHMDVSTVYIATDKGLITGHLTEMTTSTPMFNKSKELTNEEIFGNPPKEIGSVKTILGKVIVTPKEGNSDKITIINKF